MNTTLAGLVEKSRALDEGKHDMTTIKSGIHYADIDGRLSLSVDSGFIGMSEWMSMQRRAISHACTKLASPPTGYIADVCPADLAAINMNHWQQESGSGSRDTKWFVRSIADERGGQEVRACLSEFYTPISNTELLEMAADFTQELGGEVIRGYVDADTLHLKMIFVDDSTANYGFGFYLGNGEVGNRALRVAPLVQRHACTNSITMPSGTFYQKHYRVSPVRLRGDVKDELGKALRTAPDILAQIVKAEMDQIPDLAEIVKHLVERKGFSENIASEILIGTEAKRTRMGLVNGLSYAAHSTADMDQETRIDLEFFAGAMLESTQAEVRTIANSRSRVKFQA